MDHLPHESHVLSFYQRRLAATKRQKTKRIAEAYLSAMLILSRNDKRKRRNQFYFTQASGAIGPSPHYCAPWQYLYQSRNDNAWILAMGLGVTVFEHILANEFAALWNGQPIPRRETQIPRSNKSRTGGCSLDAGGALRLGLHYLNSTMAGSTLRQVLGITPAVFSRYLNWGLIALQHPPFAP
jgi:hypothetical protein